MNWLNNQRETECNKMQKRGKLMVDYDNFRNSLFETVYLKET